MKVITDSGSTKCTWLFDNGSQTTTVRTHGINAIQFSETQIAEVLRELPECPPVEAVYFYGAGCGSSFPEASAKLHKVLQSHFGCEEITIESDLTAAARALFGSGEGIACILGTGSNSCWCRNGEIVYHVPPLGYVLGDEGGGDQLGRNLINGLFKGHIPLRDEFLAAHQLTYEEIIRRVYREPYANRFLASFAPFIAAHLDTPELYAMVVSSFEAFADRNLSRYPAGLEVAFVGGIAAHFAPILRKTLRKRGYTVGKIVESPAEGVLKYHHGT